jgi:hypothetical protein
MTRNVVRIEETIEATVDGVIAIVLAAVKPKALRYALFANPFPSIEIKAAQIACWWQAEVHRVAPDLQNSEIPRNFQTHVCQVWRPNDLNRR